MHNCEINIGRSIVVYLSSSKTILPILKDILLITGSVLIFGSMVTPLQVFGTLTRFCPADECDLDFFPFRLFHCFSRSYSIQDFGWEVKVIEPTSLIHLFKNPFNR